MLDNNETHLLLLQGTGDMINEMILRRVVILTFSIGMVTGSGISYALDMGKMMNPSKWFGGNKDRGDYYDDRWGGPGYGYGGPGYGYGGPGYGYGGPGYGYGGPGYGYGGPGYGYGGGPGYGYGGAPGYGPGYGGAPAYGAQGTGSNDAEVMRLKERVRQLESGLR